MNTQRYQLRLKGLQESRGQISAERLYRVLGALLQTVEQVTRLRVTGQSTRRGKKPKWLRECVDFTVIGLRPSSTALDIEAPRFRETAYEEIAQQELWYKKPGLDETSLDLAALAIEEASRAESPGNHFDRNILEAILKFKAAAGAPGIRYDLIPQNSTGMGFTLDDHICARVSERLKCIPSPKAYIVSGRLEEIKYGRGGRFRLLLKQGSQLWGKLHPNSLDAEALRPLWGNLTTVEGMVHFKANGEARWIEAHRMSGYAEGDSVFEKIPSVRTKGERNLPVQVKQSVQSTDPMVLAGTWPGDEPIDELLAQLD